MDAATLFELPITRQVLDEFGIKLVERYRNRGTLFKRLVKSFSDDNDESKLQNGIIEFLSQFIKEGEFDLKGKKNFSVALLDTLETEIKRFQEDAAGLLEVTGVVDPPTIKRLLTRFGCGGNDRRPTDIGPDSPAPDPNSTEPHIIRYKIESLPRLGQTGTFDDSLRAVVTALESWYIHLNLRASRTTNAGDANLIISCEPLRGVPANYLALTDVGPPNGRQLRMVFDEDERGWDAPMLQACCAHEFGHALGVRHRDVPQSSQLMNDTLDANIIFPGEFDLRVAKRIWGGRNGASGAVTPNG